MKNFLVNNEFDERLQGIYGDHDAQDVDQAAGYQMVGPLSIACFALGIASLFTFIHWVVILIPIAAIVVGIVALRKLLRAPEVTTGAMLTVSGMAMAGLFGAGGYAWLAYNYYTQAPSGYEVVDWKELVASDMRTLPALAEELDGKRVFVRGFMSPTRHMTGIRKFTLGRTTKHCQFCVPVTNPTDIMSVKMMNGMTADYTTRSVGVGGMFHINRGDNPEYPRDTAYIIEADCIR